MNEDYPHSVRFVWTVRIVLSFLVVLLCVLSVFLFRSYRAFEKVSALNARTVWLHAFHPQSDNQEPSAASIQAWMTFDYINRIYGLPATYLQSQLDIVDARYPRLTIIEGAEAQKTLPSVMTQEVRDAVSGYVLRTIP